MAIATKDYGLFIGGETVEADETRELQEPATGAALGRAAMASPADVDRAVEAARAALEGPWGKTPPNERSRLIHALADAIVANRKELTELETRNVGKAVTSVKGEVAVSAEYFRWYASAIATIAGRAVPMGGSVLTYTLKEPVGVVAQIVPWNYPFMMTSWKLAPALAAGCTVVLKPDPATPLSALRLAELAVEVGIPAGVINVVPGDGPTTGSHLVTHTGIDKVAFTGSTRTGSEIMRLCAEPVKRVSLELGGKSPNIFFADADLDAAIPSSVYADLLRGRPELRRALARLRREDALRRGRQPLRRDGRADEDGRPARRGDADGLPHLADAPRQGARLRRGGARGGRRGRHRRRIRSTATALSTRRRCSRRSTTR